MRIPVSSQMAISQLGSSVGEQESAEREVVVSLLPVPRVGCSREMWHQSDMISSVCFTPYPYPSSISYSSSPVKVSPMLM